MSGLWCEEHDHLKRSCPWCEIEQLQKENQELLETIGELDSYTRMLHERNERLERELKEANAEIERQKDEMKQLRVEIERLVQENDSISKALNEAYSEIRWLQG